MAGAPRIILAATLCGLVLTPLPAPAENGHGAPQTELNGQIKQPPKPDPRPRKSDKRSPRPGPSLGGKGPPPDAQGPSVPPDPPGPTPRQP